MTSNIFTLTVVWHSETEAYTIPTLVFVFAAALRRTVDGWALPLLISVQVRESYGCPDQLPLLLTSLQLLSISHVLCVGFGG